MTRLTNDGFERTRLIDRYSELEGKARSIFGQDIDLSSDTMDGQHIGLFAETVADMDELAEAVWTSFDPDLATGHSLSRLVKINGIERSQGAYSVVELELTGTPNTLVPKGSIVANTQGTVIVYTLEDARIGQDGKARIVASPNKMGPVRASAETLTVIKSPLFGWESVTNKDTMIVGKDRETDRDLRLRRRGSVSKGNRNMTEALWAALSDLPSVTEVSVLENATPKEDSRGLPPHSVHVVVLGGQDYEIAKTIWINKTGGTVLAGYQDVIIEDITGNEQIIKFSRPVNVPIEIEVYVKPISGYVFNTQNAIKQRLADWIADNLKVGSKTINSQLYTPLNDIGGFEITSIKLGKKGGELKEQSLDMRFYERVSIDINDIKVLQS